MFQLSIQNVQTQKQAMEQLSLSVIKNSFLLGAYLIFYVRNIFEEDAFARSKLEDMKLMRLLSVSRETYLINQIFQQGVFDALEKKYVRLLFIEIKDRHDTTIESYKFGFYYQKGDILLNRICSALHKKQEIRRTPRDLRAGLKRTWDGVGRNPHPPGLDVTSKRQDLLDKLRTRRMCRVRPKEQGPIDPTETPNQHAELESMYKESLKKKSIKLFHSIMETTDNLCPLPDKSYIVVKMMYHDCTPPDYVPPWFADYPPSLDLKFETQPMQYELGKLKTGFHSLKLDMCTLARPLHQVPHIHVQHPTEMDKRTDTCDHNDVAHGNNTQSDQFESCIIEDSNGSVEDSMRQDETEGSDLGAQRQVGTDTAEVDERNRSIENDCCLLNKLKMRHDQKKKREGNGNVVVDRQRDRRDKSDEESESARDGSCSCSCSLSNVSYMRSTKRTNCCDPGVEKQKEETRGNPTVIKSNGVVINEGQSNPVDIDRIQNDIEALCINSKYITKVNVCEELGIKKNLAKPLIDRMISDGLLSKVYENKKGYASLIYRPIQIRHVFNSRRPAPPSVDAFCDNPVVGTTREVDTKRVVDTDIVHTHIVNTHIVNTNKVVITDQMNSIKLLSDQREPICSDHKKGNILEGSNEERLEMPDTTGPNNINEIKTKKKKRRRKKF